MVSTMLEVNEVNVNITMIVVVIVGLFIIFKGYNKGMAKELSGLIALVAGIFVLSMVIMLSASLREGEAVNVIYTLVLLCVFGVVYGIIKIVLGSVGAIASLPILGALDHLLGLIVGVGKAFLVIWIFFLLYANGHLGGMTAKIQSDIAASSFLQMLYESNFFL